MERLVRAGCSLGNIRAEEASGAKDDRSGLLELLDLVVEGDTLVVTHIDRLSRGLTHGLQVIEGLHRAGVEFRSLSEDFDTATATGKLQLTMVLAFSEWWKGSMYRYQFPCIWSQPVQMFARYFSPAVALNLLSSVTPFAWANSISSVVK